MNIKRTIISLLMGVSAASAYSQNVILDLSGLYNIDGVANVGDNTQTPLDGFTFGGNWVFPTDARAILEHPEGNGLNDSGIYPASGINPGYELGYSVDADEDNVLQFTASGFSAKVAVPSGNYAEIHVAAMSGNGGSGLSLTLHYTDGSTTTAGLSVPDWFSNISGSSHYYIDDGNDRIASGGNFSNPFNGGFDNANNPALFGLIFQVDISRILEGITFNGSAGGRGGPRLNIFGATATTGAANPDTDGDGISDADDACVDSILSETVVINGNDSGVANSVNAVGCSIADDLFAACSGEFKNHGQFVSCVSQAGTDLRKLGIITNKERSSLVTAAAQK